MLHTVGRPRQGCDPACTGLRGPKLLFVLSLPPWGMMCPLCPEMHTLLWAAPRSGKARAGWGTASVTMSPLLHQGRCHTSACSAINQPPVPLSGPWRDKHLPMAAAFKATPAEKITRDINLHRIMAFKDKAKFK